MPWRCSKNPVGPFGPSWRKTQSWLWEKQQLGRTVVVWAWYGVVFEGTARASRVSRSAESVREAGAGGGSPWRAVGVGTAGEVDRWAGRRRVGGRLAEAGDVPEPPWRCRADRRSGVPRVGGGDPRQPVGGRVHRQPGRCRRQCHQFPARTFHLTL